MQLSMLKQLLSKKLINETEYQVIQKINEDYGIVIHITAYGISVLYYNIINAMVGTQKGGRNGS